MSEEYDRTFITKTFKCDYYLNASSLLPDKGIKLKRFKSV